VCCTQCGRQKERQQELQHIPEAGTLFPTSKMHLVLFCAEGQSLVDLLLFEFCPNVHLEIFNMGRTLSPKKNGLELY
jgi:hypothetical protein